MTFDDQPGQAPAQGDSGSGLYTSAAGFTSAGADPNAGSAEGGAVFIAISTESPHAARGDVRMVDLARMLRRTNHPARVFQVYLTPDDGAENQRRMQMVVDRLIRERCRWAVINEVWTPEFGRKLIDAGIAIIEIRSHTFYEAIFSDDSELLGHVQNCRVDRELDEYANLVEIVGPNHPDPITAVDLRVQQSCGYKVSLADNPFYQDVLDKPEVAGHRGCAYCVSAMPRSQGTAEQIAHWITDRIRLDRQVFPSVETFWMPFAETFYESLTVAFRTMRDDPVWQGITLAMQCRPDVIAKRWPDIEKLAEDAAACGTTLRIGVVGFENFSVPEIMVLNRGATPDDLDTAAMTLNRWASKPPTGLVVKGFTPSFILFTPWTRIADLNTNLEHIAQHGLWAANIEKLRISPGTPAFVKATLHDLISDAPVSSVSHPNGYTSERTYRFVDPRVEAISAGFERLRPLAYSEQPELLLGLIATVQAAADPAAIDWDDVARAWQDVGAAARA